MDWKKKNPIIPRKSRCKGKGNCFSNINKDVKIEYDFDEPGIDDVKVTLEDELSERETKFVIDGERNRDVEDNDELENQG